MRLIDKDIPWSSPKQRN